MYLHDIRIISHYESKIIARSILWKISILFILGGITIILYPRSYYNLWNKIALDSSIAFNVSYYLNILQTFILVFICTDKKLFKRHHQDSIEIYPFDNKTFLLGNIIGILIPFLYLDLCIISITIIIQYVLTPIPLDLYIYIFYFITLIFPSLIFILTLSIWLRHIIKHSFLTLTILLSFLGITYFYLPNYFHDAFDLWGRTLPNSFSSITGHINHTPYILQRFTYLLVGIGFFYLTISRIDRITNNLLQNKISSIKGGIFIFAGLIAIFLYIETFNKIKRTRTKYRECFSRYQDIQYTIPLIHDITFEHQDQVFTANSRITLLNPSTRVMEKIILFLNPKLQITHIKYQDQIISYQRDHQAINIFHTLQPNEKIEVQIAYQGHVDENICYLDIPDHEFYDSGQNSHHVQRHGRQFAYITPDYLLLHPECLWYPVSSPLVNHDSPLNREVHFTNFHLKVAHSNKNNIISQGKRHVNDKYTTFTPEQPLPGISLCIGNFKSRSITIDSVEIELYYLPESHFIIDKFHTWDDISESSPTREVITHIKSRLEGNTLNQAYPFNRFTMLEVPVSFCSYPRWWKDESSQTQPTLVFLPERGATLQQIPFIGRKKIQMSSYFSDEIEFQNDIIILFINNNLQNWKINFESQSDEFTHFISSENYPGINSIIKQLLYLKDRSKSYVGYEPIQEKAVSFLDKHSLLEAINNSNLNTELLSMILDEKIIELQAHLSTQHSWVEIHTFLSNILSEFQFQTINFEFIQQLFQQKFNINLSKILTKWYSSSTVPTLFVKDVKFMKMDYSDPWSSYKMHLKVYNPSPTDGILTITNTPIFSNKDMVVESYIIKAGECKEIKQIYLYSSYLTVSTNLSKNIPSAYHFNTNQILYESKEYTQDTTCGTFDISPTSFYLKPGEIIVDNLDPGFSLISPQFEKLTNLFKKTKIERFSNLSGNIARWKEVIQEDFYGDVVKSAFCKEAGTGKYKAIWKTIIPESGTYEIHFHLPILKNYNISSNGFGGKLFYTVQHDNENKEIIIELDENTTGWVSLGTFNFTKNEVSIITLDDRGGRIATDQQQEIQDETSPVKQIIIADAIKWILTE